MPVVTSRLAVSVGLVLVSAWHATEARADDAIRLNCQFTDCKLHTKDGYRACGQEPSDSDFEVTLNLAAKNATLSWGKLAITVTDDRISWRDDSPIRRLSVEISRNTLAVQLTRSYDGKNAKKDDWMSFELKGECKKLERKI